MKQRSIPSLSVALAVMSMAAALLSACGGGGGAAAAPPTMHLVSISWQANHEAAVNSAGGGYIVNVSGQAPVNCPFTGFAPPCTSPTSLQLSLLTGVYTVSVTAYSALNAPGSTRGSASAPSAPLILQVP